MYYNCVKYYKEKKNYLLRQWVNENIDKTTLENLETFQDKKKLYLR